MGFLHQAINVLFYPAVAAGKIVTSGAKKAESALDKLLDGIVMFVESGLGIILIGGMTALLLLAKNPKLALLAL